MLASLTGRLGVLDRPVVTDRLKPENAAGLVKFANDPIMLLAAIMARLETVEYASTPFALPVLVNRPVDSATECVVSGVVIVVVDFDIVRALPCRRGCGILSLHTFCRGHAGKSDGIALADVRGGLVNDSKGDPGFIPRKPAERGVLHPVENCVTDEGGRSTGHGHCTASAGGNTAGICRPPAWSTLGTLCDTSIRKAGAGLCRPARRPTAPRGWQCVSG
jgi:hypothetical protein